MDTCYTQDEQEFFQLLLSNWDEEYGFCKEFNDEKGTTLCRFIKGDDGRFVFEVDGYEFVISKIKKHAQNLRKTNAFVQKKFAHSLEATKQHWRWKPEVKTFATNENFHERFKISKMEDGRWVISLKVQNFPECGYCSEKQRAKLPKTIDIKISEKN